MKFLFVDTDQGDMCSFKCLNLAHPEGQANPQMDTSSLFAEGVAGDLGETLSRALLPRGRPTATLNSHAASSYWSSATAHSTLMSFPLLALSSTLGTNRVYDAPAVLSLFLGRVVFTGISGFFPRGTDG